MHPVFKYLEGDGQKLLGTLSKYKRRYLNSYFDFRMVVNTLLDILLTRQFLKFSFKFQHFLLVIEVLRLCRNTKANQDKIMENEISHYLR